MAVHDDLLLGRRSRRRAAPAHEASSRWGIAVLFAVVCIGLAVGAYAFWPYLVREHRRLEPWKVPLIWIGNATALAWFLYYVFEHCVLRRPFRSHEPGRGWLGPLCVMLIGMGCDLAITLSHMHDEMLAHARAESAAGEVTRLQSKRFGKAVTKYDLTCRFVDRTGANHSAHFTVRDRPKGWAPPVPPPVEAAILAGKAPFAVEVSYDPEWPERNWIRGSGWDDGDRLHYFSLLPLLFQLITLPLLVALVHGAGKNDGTPLWWRDMHKAYPMLIEAAVLLLFGSMELFAQRLS